MPATRPEVTYELCYDPTDEDVLVYRSIRAGICGPFSDTRPARSREEADNVARSMGFVRTGPWSSHRNYDSAPLVRMS